ncbi:MAG: Ig-like domain-containing protein [Gemmatimonadaceae bacterium]|nr:Ig-like domain-containing protein [Gemmatimonadaceae bacterium]
MLTILRSSQLTRAVRRRAGAMALSAIALSTLLGACSGDSDVVAPGTDSPAHVAFNMSVQASAAQTSQVRVNARYLLAPGGYANLSTQVITLTGGASQQVPIGLDLANCLRDANRGGLSGAVAADECVVQLELELVLDGVSVDRQFIGPFSLRPGQTNTVTDPIPLTDISTVTITAPPANVVAPGQPLRVEVARTMALTSTITNGAGQTVTGRSPTWSSSAPSVATVSATGVVTAVGPGTTRIVAEVGNRLAAVDVRVVPQPQVLTIVSSGFSGTGTITSAPAGISCTINGQQVTGACNFTFPGDVSVVLTATPASGSELVGWAGDCSGTQGAACQVNMNAARNVGIAFRAMRNLRISGAGSGLGTINGDQGGILCVSQGGTTTGTCSATFVEGAVVTLSVSAAGQSIFRGWTGDACSGSTATTCQITMNGDRNITARFEAPVTVTIRGTGQGNGQITSTPLGIQCNLVGANGSGACTALFNEGTSITLNAAAASGHSFRSWGGDCAGQTGTQCILPITGSARNVTVQFDPPAVITVVPTGTGDGQVFAGGVINCLRANGSNSGQCSATVSNGTVLTLTALPDGESEFSGWTGACSGATLCQVTMDQARTVTAVFTRRQVQLTLTLLTSESGGYGSVRTASGFTCTLNEGESSKQCITFVDVSRSLILTATPGAEQTFSAFTGSCISSSATCSFIVTANAAVTATFGPPTGQITVSPEFNSTGNGVVYLDDPMEMYSSPIDCAMTGASINSGSTCSQTVPGGTTVTLIASADVGHMFATWGGACASFGSSPSCTLLANANLTVTARFISVPTVTVSVTLSGMGVGGQLLLSGNSFSQSCTRPANESNPTTVCNLQVPSGQGFSAILTGFSGAIGTFTSGGSICQMSSSPCTEVASSGVTTTTSIAAMFFSPSPPAIKASGRSGD